MMPFYSFSVGDTVVVKTLEVLIEEFGQELRCDGLSFLTSMIASCGKTYVIKTRSITENGKVRYIIGDSTGDIHFKYNDSMFVNPNKNYGDLRDNFIMNINNIPD